MTIIDANMSVNGVLSSAKPGDTIYLKQGIYKEKIIINIDNIKIIGENPERTIITNGDYFHKILDDGNEANTFRTYSCLVLGKNVTISNLTIENTSLPSHKYGQAVALHVCGDNFNCENVILKSAQDTLFTGPLQKDLIERYTGFLLKEQLKPEKTTQIYKNCKIYGDTDFIFGSAQALFYKCDIISIGKGFLAAPAHSNDMKYGYLFYKCNLISTSDASGTYFARPWRDYGCAAFIDCKVGSHIDPKGFNKWDNTNRDKTARFYEYSENVDISKRENWVNELTKIEAKNYVDNYLAYINYKNEDLD